MGSGPADVAGQMRHIDADPGHGARPFRLMVAAEQNVVVSLTGQPDILDQFSLQLALPPAGVSHRQDGPTRRAHRIGHGHQDFAGRGYGQAAGDQQRGGRIAIVVRMQNKAAFGLDGATDQDRTGTVREPARDLQGLEQLIQVEIVVRRVQAQTHGMAGIMGAHEDHRLFEAGVADVGHGQEQATDEAGGLGHPLMMAIPGFGDKPSWIQGRRDLSPRGSVAWTRRNSFMESDMTIKVGDRIPSATLMTMGDDGPQAIQTDAFLAGKTTALFAVPGAFTPTCSARHLPGFRDRAGALRDKGVDQIACLSVNDAFVMGAWAADQDINGEVVMLADGNGDFTRALGLELDASKFGMGGRSQRYSMVIEDGVVTALNVEEGGEFRVSSAEFLLDQL